MRRENRINNKTTTDKIILYAGIGVAILAVIVISLFMYSKSLSDGVKDSTMSLEKMANMTNSNAENTQSASTEMGKSVEESKNEINTVNETNSVNTTNQNNTMNNTNVNTTNTTTTTNKVNAENVATNSNVAKAESKKELTFAMPVEGEIAKEFAQENLIYSDTLEEWTTHSGIDIRAEKTTVVKAAEAGTIKSIKNDPRYGMTIIIEHEDNYQTIYSNLLTSEFVVEGEQVEKGQSIGTVGNSAVFEIADEPHLHFEIWKDSLPVDPSLYIK